MPNKFFSKITVLGVETIPIGLLKRVNVLENIARNVKAVVHDLPLRSYVDGLLGLSFLKYFDLVVKLGKGFLELKPSELLICLVL